VAKYCHVTADTVRKWAEAGRIRVFKTPGGHRRIRRGDLLEFLQANRIPLHAELSDGGVRILVIEQEKVLSPAIRRFLERTKLSFQIKVAMDVFDAGYQLASFQPGIVFLDGHLAAIDVLDVCRRIKSAPEHAGTSIIVVTEAEGGLSHERVLEAGAALCLRKPFTPDDLRRVLAKVGVELP
jgi:excisionase family DNA binding protein